MKKVFCLLFSFCLLQEILASSDDTHDLLFQRIHSHLIVGDRDSAIRESKQLLRAYPADPAAHHLHIKALAAEGDVQEMCMAWHRYQASFPNEHLPPRDLAEGMAWGVIVSGTQSSSPIIRIITLMAAFFSNDAKSVDILLAGSRDANIAVRAASVQLMGQMHDQPLIDRLLSLLDSETSWPVRLEVIKALGRMEVTQGRAQLAAIVADPKSQIEEKKAAIAALVAILDKISRLEILLLARSDRAGLRQLACEVILHLDSQRDLDLVWELAGDRSASVRAGALRTLGLMVKSSCEVARLKELAAERLGDGASDVAISAAWLMAIHAPERAERIFADWLKYEEPKYRHLAVAALAAAGAHAIAAAWPRCLDHEDAFVRINMAIGMIQHRVHSERACEVLYRELMVNSKPWSWDDEGSFHTLVPGGIAQSGEALVSPEAINQLTRLELLNMLAVLKFPSVQEAVQHFLNQRKWGISGSAALLLLTEGNEDALELIEKIMCDARSPIKIQAALVLALWGRDPKAIQVLEEGYGSADRDAKERILEGIGRIGAESSIPFLLERLEEPQQTLRLQAAAALLQSLYH